MCGELTAQPHVRRTCGPVRHPCESSHTHAIVMGSRFLAPYTELIRSGSVSDFVTMSEPLDKGAKCRITFRILYFEFFFKKY